jgi:hypothetical protein
MSGKARFEVAVLALLAPVLMGAYPEKPGDVVGMYGAAGTVLGPPSVSYTGPPMSFSTPKLYWYLEGALSYRRTFKEGKLSLGLDGGVTHSFFNRFSDLYGGKGTYHADTDNYVRCDPRIPEGCDAALAAVTILYLDPYVAYNPWRYFGFDLGVFVRYTDRPQKKISDYFDSTVCVLPSAAVRLGTLDMIYLEAYLLRPAGPLFDSWVGANVVLVEPLFDLAIGVSLAPHLFAPQAALRVAVTDLVTIPISGSFGFDSTWGASTGAELRF